MSVVAHVQDTASALEAQLESQKRVSADLTASLAAAEAKAAAALSGQQQNGIDAAPTEDFESLYQAEQTTAKDAREQAATVQAETERLVEEVRKLQQRVEAAQVEVQREHIRAEAIASDAAQREAALVSGAEAAQDAAAAAEVPGAGTLCIVPCATCAQ